jgi:hypothetical protein
VSLSKKNILITYDKLQIKQMGSNFWISKNQMGLADVKKRTNFRVTPQATTIFDVVSNLISSNSLCCVQGWYGPLCNKNSTSGQMYPSWEGQVNAASGESYGNRHSSWEFRGSSEESSLEVSSYQKVRHFGSLGRSLSAEERNSRGGNASRPAVSADEAAAEAPAVPEDHEEVVATTVVSQKESAA